jgi:predicted RNA-binding protein with PUA-like domain
MFVAYRRHVSKQTVHYFLRFVLPATQPISSSSFDLACCSHGYTLYTQEWALGWNEDRYPDLLQSVQSRAMLYLISAGSHETNRNISKLRVTRQRLPSWRKIAMTYFLVKTDPDHYSIENLQHDNVTAWDGVRHPQAVATIKKMRPGDEVLIYHSQGEAAIVGLARVVSEPRPDSNDSKSWVVDVEFARRFARPITLREIKDSHQFDEWSLVRQGRLSTMSVPDEFIAWLKEQKVF